MNKFKKGAAFIFFLLAAAGFLAVIAFAAGNPPEVLTLIAPPHDVWIDYDPTFKAEVYDPDGDMVRAHFKVIKNDTGVSVNGVGSWVEGSGISEWGPVNLGNYAQYDWKAYPEDATGLESGWKGYWRVKIDKGACQCSSSDGPCCSNNCDFDSSSTVCGTEAEYQCSGTSCGDDYQKRTKDRYCSGDAAACTGSYSAPSGWATVQDCDSDSQRCSLADGGCIADPSCAPADTVPPVVSNVRATNITQNSADIRWTTNEPATSQVLYGATPSYGQQTSEDPSLKISHALLLSNLQLSTVYHFQIVSKDAVGNQSVSGDSTFTTEAEPELEPEPEPAPGPAPTPGLPTPTPGLPAPTPGLPAPTPGLPTPTPESTPEPELAPEPGPAPEPASEPGRSPGAEPEPAPTPGFEPEQKTSDIIEEITDWLKVIVLGIGLIMIIYSGIVIMTAGSDKERIAKGKKILIWAIVGVAIAVVADIIVATVRGLLE